MRTKPATPLRDIIFAYAINAYELNTPVSLEHVNRFLGSWGRAPLTASELQALLPSQAQIDSALRYARVTSTRH